MYGLGVLLLVALVGVVLWAAGVRPALFTPFDGGMGTESSPWKISTVEQLVAIDSDDTYLDGAYVLVDDVDFDDVDDAEFVGIGDSDRPFTGNFDGGGHTIENFSVQTNEENGVGLFRFSDGTIESIDMIGVDIVAADSSIVEPSSAAIGEKLSGQRQTAELKGRRRSEVWWGGMWEK